MCGDMQKDLSVWWVVKVGMHALWKSRPSERLFAISREYDRFSRNGPRCRLRNDAAINFCHNNFFIWSLDEGDMTDSLKLSSVGRSLRTIPVLQSPRGKVCGGGRHASFPLSISKEALRQEASSHKGDEGLPRTMKSKC